MQRGSLLSKWPALPLAAVVSSQPKLPLRSMSESVAMQHQRTCRWIISLQENMGLFLIRAATRNYVDVLAPPLTGCCIVEDLPHLSLVAALGKAGPAPCPVELTPVAEAS